MGITNRSKQISPTKIAGAEAVHVRLALAAAPSLANSPADIVLVLSCAPSLVGAPLLLEKRAAQALVRGICASMDGGAGGNLLRGGNRIALIHFAAEAVTDLPLVTSAARLIDCIECLASPAAGCGSVACERALAQAIALLANGAPTRKIILLFGDGAGCDTMDCAVMVDAARATGATLYCLALEGANGLNAAALECCATGPWASHVVHCSAESDLAPLLCGLTSGPAREILVEETLHPDFDFRAVFPPTCGQAEQVSSSVLRWRIAALGGGGDEGAVLEYDVQNHVNCVASKRVSDCNCCICGAHSAAFPAAWVQVDCP